LSQREIYPRSPLRVVTAEFRFPLSTVLSDEDMLPLLAAALGDAFPIIEPANVASVRSGPTFVTQGPGFASSRLEVGYRFLSRDRTSAVTVGSTRMAVETTHYESWMSFSEDLVYSSLQAVGEGLNAFAGLERVGLRFINEIRVPSNPRTPNDWASFISPNLLAASDLALGGSVRSIQNVIQFEMNEQVKLRIRTGNYHSRVGSQGPLKFRHPAEAGPYFLIDMDSYWMTPGILSPWDISEAMRVTESLHDPIDQLFEACITESYREEVLRRRDL
jgi:uncharacterized protein (TIGR04255 family)